MTYETAETIAETVISNHADDPIEYDAVALAEAILAEHEEEGRTVTYADAKAMMEEYRLPPTEVAAIYADMRAQEQFDWARDNI